MTGTCTICGREITVSKNGNIRNHGSRDRNAWPPTTCEGAGKAPAEQ